MKAKIYDNFDADVVAKIFAQEITRALNMAAEAIAGGASGGEAVGIRSVFSHDSKGTGKPSPKGTPPGVDTGTLRRSFRTRPTRREGDTIRVAAGTERQVRHETRVRNRHASASVHEARGQFGDAVHRPDLLGIRAEDQDQMRE
jgi:hypothetical protein